jgi:hypothetical protein
MQAYALGFGIEIENWKLRERGFMQVLEQEGERKSNRLKIPLSPKLTLNLNIIIINIKNICSMHF